MKGLLVGVQGRLTKEDVDMRMCKTLADMPSDLALEAVDKFAMASLDTVRSKTGFMVCCFPSAFRSFCQCPAVANQTYWLPGAFFGG